MSDKPIVLVFGAYGGIGARVSRNLAEQGVELVLSGRDGERLGSLAAELGALSAPADATDFESVVSAVNAAVERHGRIDGIASCVGSLLLKPAHLTSEDEWAETVHTNLTSAFAVVRAGVRPMMKQKGGSIVLVSTAAASIGLANHEAVAAAKGGIDALVRSAAATYGRSGIRVNAVAPGLVGTPLTERITSSVSALQASESMHALRRIGQAQDVAEAIQWLLLERTGWITGQTLGVDGGLGSVRSA